MIAILSKSNDPSAIAHNALQVGNGVASPRVLQDILHGSDTQTQYFRVRQDDLYDGEQNYIRIQRAKGSGKGLIAFSFEQIERVWFALRGCMHLEHWDADGSWQGFPKPHRFL
jgi:hypothetical protein